VFDNEPWNIDVRISWWSNLAEKLERFVLPGSTPPQYPPSLVAGCQNLKRKERGLPGLLLGPAAPVPLTSEELSLPFMISLLRR